MAYPRFQRARDFKVRAGTAGYASTSTTWANVDTGLDIILLAQVGDVIEVSMEGFWDNTAQFKFLDVATIVSGSVINYFGNDSTDPGTGEGIRSWYGSGFIANNQVIGGGSVRQLVSGDIENGTVRLRLRFRGITTTARTFTFHKWWAKNLGPVDPN